MTTSLMSSPPCTVSSMSSSLSPWVSSGFVSDAISMLSPQSARSESFGGESDPGILSLLLQSLYYEDFVILLEEGVTWLGGDSDLVRYMDVCERAKYNHVEETPWHSKQTFGDFLQQVQATKKRLFA